MPWLASIENAQPVAWTVLVLSAVAILGFAIGSIRVRGVSLGVAGVLFAGIAFGHFGVKIEPAALDFVKEFGLILFVYTIGMQVGRGFFASLRAQGLPMNLLAAGIILAGSSLAVGLSLAFDLDMPAMLGVLSGATTNTPALGATQQALQSLPGVTAEMRRMPGLGYAVAYPGAIAGLILGMIILRRLFRVDVDAENSELERRQKEAVSPPERMSIRVDNDNLEGLALRELRVLRDLEVTISRIRPAGERDVIAALDETALHKGDVLLAVGAKEGLDQLRIIIGSESDEDLAQAPSGVASRRVVVTRREVLGKTLADLALRARHGVNVTRVTRADLEMPAGPALRLQFGDMLQLVGRPEDVGRAAELLGNSARALNQTNLLAIFVGIALGVAVGLYPIEIAGMPVPLRLGLAGGPLIVAILISRLGHLGPIIWHMPMNANLALRELGLTLFLAAVGLRSGESFVSTIVEGDGIAWMASGLAITMVPVLLGGLVGRLVMKLDFSSLCGIIAGSNTDPPALAFANEANRSEAPTVAYVNVYPLTMVLRILVAQVLTILLCG